MLKTILMQYAENILGTIGNTPLVKLNKLTADLPCLVLAKYETFNPGNSTKDRMALQMIEDAEADGRLKPGGTIIEGTSGNTGMGLALAAVVKGYKMICVISDKQSKEKMDILRAVGSEVHVCPTDVAPDDPRSYYSTSKRLSTEIPNSWYVNQNDNPRNLGTNRWKSDSFCGWCRYWRNHFWGWKIFKRTKSRCESLGNRYVW